MDRRYFLKANVGLAASGLAATASGLAAADSQSVSSSGYEKLPDLEFSKEEYLRRYEAIRKAMDEEGVDVLLVTGNYDSFGAEMSSLWYLGAGRGFNKHAPEMIVFPKNGNPILLLSTGGFLPAFPPPKNVPLETEPSPVLPDPMNETPNYAATMIEMVKKMGFAKGTIGLMRSRVFPTDDYIKLREALPDAKFVDAERLFNSVKHVKSEEEQEFMRRSALCCDLGHQVMIDMLQPGVDHFDIYYAVDQAITRIGGGALGTPQFITSVQPRRMFGGISVYGGTKKIQLGDLVMNEITTHYKGYFTQMIVPISMGDPDPWFTEAWQMNDVMYKAVFNALKPGMHSNELDQIGAEAVKEASNGKFESIFTMMTTEKEYTLSHDWEVKAGVPFTLMPLFGPANKPSDGFRGHIYANTVLTTNSKPEVLQKTPMDILVL